LDDHFKPSGTVSGGLFARIKNLNDTVSQDNNDDLQSKKFGVMSVREELSAGSGGEKMLTIAERVKQVQLMEVEKLARSLVSREGAFGRGNSEGGKMGRSLNMSVDGGADVRAGSLRNRVDGLGSERQRRIQPDTYQKDSSAPGGYSTPYQGNSGKRLPPLKVEPNIARLDWESEGQNLRPRQ
jgi:hypothetical protein